MDRDLAEALASQRTMLDPPGEDPDRIDSKIGQTADHPHCPCQGLAGPST